MSSTTLKNYFLAKRQEIEAEKAKEFEDLADGIIKPINPNEDEQTRD